MKRILIVDESAAEIEVLTQMLMAEGHNVQSAPNYETALHRLRAWKPHMLLCEANPHDDQWAAFVKKIRTTPSDDYIALILLCNELNPADVTKVLEVGVDDYLIRPLQSETCVARVRVSFRMKEVHDSLRRLGHRLEELSSTDDLTGLLNVRTIYRRGEEEIQRSKRFKKPISAIMVNLDGFSAVNQGYGFTFGSQVLQEIGRILQKCLRTVDLVARIGADEFFVLLVETDLAGAEFAAERVRDAVESEVFRNDKSSIKITTSIGVAGLTPNLAQQEMSGLIHAASDALRSAKANGPNQIEVYSFA